MKFLVEFEERDGEYLIHSNMPLFFMEIPAKADSVYTKAYMIKHTYSDMDDDPAYSWEYTSKGWRKIKYDEE